MKSRGDRKYFVFNCILILLTSTLVTIIVRLPDEKGFNEKSLNFYWNKKSSIW